MQNGIIKKKKPIVDQNLGGAPVAHRLDPSLKKCKVDIVLNMKVTRSPRYKYYTGWTKKQQPGMVYFPQHVDAITGIIHLLRKMIPRSAILVQ